MLLRLGVRVLISYFYRAQLLSMKLIYEQEKNNAQIPSHVVILERWLKNDNSSQKSSSSNVDFRKIPLKNTFIQQ